MAMKKDVMTAIELLKLATVEAQCESDLPDYLAERIFGLVEDLREASISDREILALAEQVALYDTYGQTGYIGMGVDNNILEGSLQRMEEMIRK